MANKEQRERIFGIVHVLASRAIEQPPEDRPPFIRSEVEEIRREFAQEQGRNPVPPEVADKLQKSTEMMVEILEEAGG